MDYTTQIAEILGTEISVEKREALEKLLESVKSTAFQPKTTMKPQSVAKSIFDHDSSLPNRLALIVAGCKLLRPEVLNDSIQYEEMFVECKDSIEGQISLMNIISIGADDFIKKGGNDLMYELLGQVRPANKKSRSIKHDPDIVEVTEPKLPKPSRKIVVTEEDTL